MTDKLKIFHSSLAAICSQLLWLAGLLNTLDETLTDHAESRAPLAVHVRKCNKSACHFYRRQWGVCDKFVTRTRKAGWHDSREKHRNAYLNFRLCNCFWKTAGSSFSSSLPWHNRTTAFKRTWGRGNVSLTLSFTQQIKATTAFTTIAMVTLKLL